ncbi:MAG: hypothetical protein V1915_04360 [Candidatus Bathyarchaeota archaeon]
MGGAKKRNLAQAEKQQQMQASKQQKEQKTKSSKAENQEKKGGVLVQGITEKDFAELAKIKALTLYSVANKYNVKLSIAKDILQTLEEKKTVEQVASSGGLKIYKFIGAA